MKLGLGDQIRSYKFHTPPTHPNDTPNDGSIFFNFVDLHVKNSFKTSAIFRYSTLFFGIFFHFMGKLMFFLKFVDLKKSNFSMIFKSSNPLEIEVLYQTDFRVKLNVRSDD